MKKQILDLEGVQVLTKDQMKNVSGKEGGTCAFYGGTSGDGEPIGGAGLSKAFVIQAAKDVGGRWCCDSCASASWYNSLLY